MRSAPDKLERLVFPAAILSPAVREELKTRMGPTVEFRQVPRAERHCLHGR